MAYNLGTGVTTVIAEGSSGRSVSPDGNFLAFYSSYALDPMYPTSGGVFRVDMQSGANKLISLAISGAPATFYGASTSIGENGRYVVFTAADANLVANDTNGFSDVFFYDNQAGTIELISVGTGGAQANGESYLGYSQLVVSNDGRYVAFASNASNLVTGDANGTKDVFVRDRVLGTTERISVSSLGTEVCGIDAAAGDPAITADGRFVAFSTGGWNLSFENGPVPSGYGHTYLRDRNSAFSGIVASINVLATSIKLTSNKRFEVHVFSTQDFDATQIDLASAKFANAPATDKLTGDFNGDGRIDASFKFYPNGIIIDTACTQGIFTGTLVGTGTKVAGYDSVSFVP